MRDSDIRIVDASVAFHDVELDQPLTLANASITHFTVAEVTVRAEDRAGRSATGVGASTLSVPWSWPEGTGAFEHRDAHLRSVVHALVVRAHESGPGDPFEHWSALDGELAAFADVGDGDAAPRLALDLALGAVDNAVHDAWARVAGRPAWELYTADHLNADAGAWLGPGCAGIWPGDGWAAPRRVLPVQHVVGVTDPLTGPGGTGRPLDDWLRREGLRHVKIKLRGSDPRDDASRVAAIAAIVAQTTPQFDLALDPNEGYASVGGAVELMERLRADHPAVAERISYLEQPVPRAQSPDPAELAALREYVPVIMDEGLAEVTQLGPLRDDGWSGLVVKASKGQSLALLSQVFTRRNGLFLAVQDLTATGRALEHSARLASVLPVSSPAFEYNSRQYAPRANEGLARRRPELVSVAGGAVIVGVQTEPGIV